MCENVSARVYMCVCVCVCECERTRVCVCERAGVIASVNVC
jgi:hypothetical protein